MGIKTNNAVGVKGRSGRKSLPQEFALVANIDMFSPKFWKNLHKMIDCKLENTLSPAIIESLAKVFQDNPRMLKDVIETLATNSIKQREFAMEQFNRIQVKRIPQDITSGGKPIPLLNNISQPNVFTYTSTTQSSETPETD